MTPGSEVPTHTFVVEHGTALEIDGHVSLQDLSRELERAGMPISARRAWESPGEPDTVAYTLENGTPGQAVIVHHFTHGAPRGIVATRLEIAGMAGNDADLALLRRLAVTWGGTLIDETGRTTAEQVFVPCTPVYDLGPHAVKDGTVRLCWRPSAKTAEMTALDGEGEIVGQVVFDRTGEGALVGRDLYVHPGRRRKGVATALYDAAEALGHRVTPSDDLDEDGHLFWEARSGGPAPAP